MAFEHLLEYHFFLVLDFEHMPEHRFFLAEALGIYQDAHTVGARGFQQTCNALDNRRQTFLYYKQKETQIYIRNGFLLF